MMARIVIDPGNAPASEESLDLLREELQDAFGDELQVAVADWQGPRELREGHVPIDQVIDLFFNGLTATAALATAVRAWRRKGKAPPYKITRIQAWEFDQDGHPRRAWIEEEETGP